MKKTKTKPQISLLSLSLSLSLSESKMKEEAMEAILRNTVQNSLRHFMYKNAIFFSEFLCAEFPSEMDLLNEAEAALCPANEPIAEVPNGGAGHYLLGLVYRYTDRRTNAVHHFKQALSLDPLLWTAYEELCILEEDRNLTSSRNLVSAEEVSPRQLKQLSGNNVREVPGSCQGMTTSVRGAGQPPNGVYHLSLYNTPSPIATQFSAAAPPPLCRNLQPNGSNTSTAAADSSPRSTINSTIQAPRRKFVDEGKLRKISGRLFSDSGPRRSTRLAAEAGANAGTNAASVAGNGTNNSSKYLGSSKLSSAAFRSVTVRKVPNWANENFDEGEDPLHALIFPIFDEA
ncbi:hypothetical protein CRG98_047307 [Punica granatum]|uniref:Uncharacterized protein n=1 Tax=Punica granatum TaxID=22663 RepID=A0A2I0HKU3_PUNGR|nr:hypothetical protein CRG98_047307 [Punica granatum]